MLFRVLGKKEFDPPVSQGSALLGVALAEASVTSQASTTFSDSSPSVKFPPKLLRKESAVDGDRIWDLSCRSVKFYLLSFFCLEIENSVLKQVLLFVRTLASAGANVVKGSRLSSFFDVCGFELLMND